MGETMGYLALSLALISFVLLVYILYLKKKMNYEIKRKLKEKEEDIRKDAVERSRSTLKGKISEHLAPFSEEFEYNASDARFLGSPIDYVVFDGMSDGSEEIKIVFADVKTGSSKLSSVQRKIKKAVEEGQVKWSTLNLE